GISGRGAEGPTQPECRSFRPRVRGVLRVRPTPWKMTCDAYEAFGVTRLCQRPAHVHDGFRDLTQVFPVAHHISRQGEARRPRRPVARNLNLKRLARLGSSSGLEA